MLGFLPSTTAMVVPNDILKTLLACSRSSFMPKGKLMFRLLNLSISVFYKIGFPSHKCCRDLLNNRRYTDVKILSGVVFF